MRRFTRLIMVVALAAAASSALSGCANIAQRATEVAVEKTTGVKVDTQNQKITTTDKNGNKTELSAQDGKYPDGFPSDFPQYANGKVASSLAGTTSGQQSFTVIVKTGDDPKTVYEWYLGELETAGWTVEQKMNSTTTDAAFASIVAAKGTQKAGVTISKGSGETETSIMIGLGPKQ